MASCSISLCFALSTQTMLLLSPATRSSSLTSPRQDASRELSRLTKIRRNRGCMLNTIVFINALSAGNDGDSTRQDIHGREAGKGFPLEIKHEEAQDGVWIRYFYHGGKLTRDGRLIRLMLNSDDAEHGNVKATQVIDLLQQENIDLRRFCPHAYDRDLEAWAPLSGETTFSIAEEGPQRIDVQLFTSAAIPGSNSSERNLDESDFCSIGVFGAKSEKNLGTLWRSGYQLGAAEVFVIGERFRTESKKRQKDKLLRVKQNLGRSRMLRSDDSIPLHEFQDWNAFTETLPAHTCLVAVEMGGTSLDTFEHPERAIYILGSEDTGLPQAVMQACDAVVELPAVRTASFNVAVAGSIVLYDRLVKRGKTACQ
mmetsp:Transcript_16621/g.39992  ORF Transcript_16621/g.39992 Transcript_16621/m.39992 type:complete len:369 (+) Transcript_16621:260-1366(+)